MAIRTRTGSHASHPITTKPFPTDNGASRSARRTAGDQPAGGFRRMLRGSVALCAVLMASGAGLAAVRRRGTRSRRRGGGR